MSHCVARLDLGDAVRTLTFEYMFQTLEEIQSLWPGKPNGWLIPEKAPDKHGAKRFRKPRHRGYMLVQNHEDVNGKGSNKMLYNIIA